MVPFWVPKIRPRIRPRIIIGTQKGTIILTIPHLTAHERVNDTQTLHPHPGAPEQCPRHSWPGNGHQRAVDAVPVADLEGFSKVWGFRV